MMQVVACFLGKGRVAGLEKYVEGRLWQYRDGDIGFLWIMDDDNSDGCVQCEIQAGKLLVQEAICMAVLQRADVSSSPYLCGEKLYISYIYIYIIKALGHTQHPSCACRVLADFKRIDADLQC